MSPQTYPNKEKIIEQWTQDFTFWEKKRDELGDPYVFFHQCILLNTHTNSVLFSINKLQLKKKMYTLEAADM